MNSRVIIETNDLHKTYRMGETEVHALRGISLQIHQGEMVAITGPSGSGKSTLMAILGALDQPTKGSYRLDGLEIGKLHDDDLALIRNQRIGFVFQQFNLLARNTALEKVALPLVYSGLPARIREERARQKLEAVGVLMSVAVSRTLSAPLDRLAAAARAIGAGRLDQRVAVGGSQEIVTVAQAFNDMAQALEEAEKLRRNMVADVAHELRTPLSVLQGNLQAILDDVYPLDKAEIARLYAQTQLLGRLIEDLRLLSQADAGQLSLSLQRVDLGSLVADQVGYFSPLAAEKGITLSKESAPNLPPAWADPARVGQVLHNLLDNALRHTPPGGTVCVRVIAEEDYLRLEVQDSGEGIPPEHLPHIFDRFYRVDSARGRNTGGAGLGLAIARSIVTAHGGTIHAESDPESGHGSTFVARLPVARDDEPPAMAPPAPGR